MRPSPPLVLRSSGDYHGGGYHVIGVEVEEADPSVSLKAGYGGSPPFGFAQGRLGADALGVDANDLAELRDDPHFCGVGIRVSE